MIDEGEVVEGGGMVRDFCDEEENIPGEGGLLGRRRGLLLSRERENDEQEGRREE